MKTIITPKYLFFAFVIPMITLLVSCQKENDDSKSDYFIKVFGNQYLDEGVKIIEDNDQGYLLLANTQDDADKDMLILKVDRNGNEQWRQQIVEDSVDNTAYDFYTNNSNEIIVLGSTTDSAGSEQILVVKMDKTNGEIWRSKIGASHKDEVGKSIIPTSDGGSLIVGYSLVIENSIKNRYFLRINEDGNVEATNYHFDETNTNNNEYSNIIRLDDDKSIITGYTDGTLFSPSEFANRVVVVKNLDGGTENIFEFPVSENHSNYGIQSFLDETGNLYVMGNSTTNTGVNNISFTKFRDGFVEGDISYIEIMKLIPSSNNDYISSFANTNNNDGFIVVGRSAQSDINDICVKKVSHEGEIIFEEMFGSFEQEIGTSILPTDDGGFMILGTIGSGSNTDICLIKTNSSGLLSK